MLKDEYKMNEEEKMDDKIEKERQSLNNQIENLINKFEYYNKLTEEIRKLLVEYEIEENVLCFSTGLTTSNSIVSDNLDSNLEIDLEYVVKVLCNDQLFQFRAENFEDKNTKFEVRIYSNNPNSETKSFWLKNLDEVKDNIIKWLITI